MAVTTLRRKKDKMYSIAPSGADYLALIDTGGSWLAAAYIDGTWVSDLATQALTADPNYSVSFHDDRYVVAADFGALDVWDLDTDTVESYAVPAGWFLLGAGISGGAVYWIELEEVWGGGPGAYTVQGRLRSAADPADLGTVTTVQTHVFTYASELEWNLDTTGSFMALNATAAMAQRNAVIIPGGSTIVYVRFRFPLSGGAGTDDGGTSNVMIVNVGVPEASGGSFLYDGDIGGASLHWLDDDVAADAVEHWPSTGVWVTSPVSDVSTNAAGTEVAVYGINDGELRMTRSSNVGPYTTPTSQFIVTDHPTEGSPTYFFIRG